MFTAQTIHNLHIALVRWNTLLLTTAVGYTCHPNPTSSYVVYIKYSKFRGTKLL
jgi:hypothetical protein